MIVEDMEKNRRQAIADVQDIRQELLESDWPSDILDVAGISMLFGKKKEMLEEKYGLRWGPNFLTCQMISLLVLLEIFLISCVVLLLVWAFKIRQGALDFDLLLRDFGKKRLWATSAANTTDVPEQSSSQEEMYKVRLTQHTAIFSLTFLLVLPHVVILRILFQNADNICLQAMVVILKLGSLCLVMIGWYDITSVELLKQTRDCGTHAFFAKATLGLVVIYNSITIVRISGRMFRNLYRIRLVGGILRQIITQKFEDLIQQLCSISALTSMLTGILAFIFYLKHKEGIEHESQEYWVIRATILLLLGSFVLFMIVSIIKHYISHHMSCISVETFQEFVELEKKRQRCKNWEDASKITKPVVRN